MTPRRNLTRAEWLAAYQAARLCRMGERPHAPVNWLAKLWALAVIHSA